MLQVRDVVQHLFGEPVFARFAGTRTQALLDSPLYERLDNAHGKAISELAREDVRMDGSDEEMLPGHAANGASESTRSERVQGTASDSDFELGEVSDPDPLDEVMTAHGDTMTLFFGLFIDGVSLHQHGRSSTTVVAIKCMDLPGFLCNTDLACYPLAFIDGPKEPTNLVQFMALILRQFKEFEPMGAEDEQGVLPGTDCLCS